MKEEKYPVLIFRDEKFENETRASIKQLLVDYQKLLDIWNGLDVGELTDLFTLASQPGLTYSKAYKSQINIPEIPGKIQINKSVYMDLIDPALPNNLYVTAKACQKSPVFGQDIYSITGGEVVLDEAKAENIINGNNVYAENEFQQKLGESIISWVETGNYLIQQFGTLDFKHAMAFPWSLEAKMFPSLDKLKIEPSQIRYILQNQG